MKILITESQNNFLWLRRRLKDSDLMGHLREIVVEGFDYSFPCNYVNDINNPLERYDEYLLDIATGSIWTFYYSYDELKCYGHDLKKLELFLFNLIKTKFGKLIKTHFLDSIEECEEEKK